MKKNILLVDDKQVFRQLTKIILHDDFNVETASNGIHALSLLQKGFIPDLIVCDLMMPELGGEAFLEQVKTSGAFKKIPVIILSSIDKSEQRIKILKQGAYCYMTKPYNPEELRYNIDRILNPEIN